MGCTGGHGRAAADGKPGICCCSALSTLDFFDSIVSFAKVAAGPCLLLMQLVLVFPRKSGRVQHQPPSSRQIVWHCCVASRAVTNNDSVYVLCAAAAVGHVCRVPGGGQGLPGALQGQRHNCHPGRRCRLGGVCGKRGRQRSLPRHRQAGGLALRGLSANLMQHPSLVMDGKGCCWVVTFV